MTTELYTANDIKTTKEELLKKQKGKCLVSGETIQGKDACLDHSHSTQKVRGVLHRQVNTFLGRVENGYMRDLSWWSKVDLPSTLRALADYLVKDTKDNPLHPGWLQRVKIDFNKLPENKKQYVLGQLGVEQSASNSTQRKELFRKALLTRQFTFQEVSLIIASAESI